MDTGSFRNKIWSGRHIRLSSGANIEAKDSWSKTPLNRAVFFKYNLVEKLLISGAEVNAKDVHGITPFQYAVWGGRTKIVSLLIKHGADINSVTGKTTSLHTSVMKGHYEIAEILIENDSKLNFIDVDGKTPLDLAVELQREKFVDLLKRNGAKRFKEL